MDREWVSLCSPTCTRRLWGRCPSPCAASPAQPTSNGRSRSGPCSSSRSATVPSLREVRSERVKRRREQQVQGNGTRYLGGHLLVQEDVLRRQVAVYDGRQEVVQEAHSVRDVCVDWSALREPARLLISGIRAHSYRVRCSGAGAGSPRACGSTAPCCAAGRTESPQPCTRTPTFGCLAAGAIRQYHATAPTEEEPEGRRP